MTGQIIDGIANAIYQDDALGARPSLNAGICKILCSRSPLHAWTLHPRLNPHFERDSDPKYDVGTAAHALLLEGRDAVFIVGALDWRTADAKAMREEARAEGKIPLLSAQWQEVQRMCEAVREQLDALDVDPVPLTDGKPEQTLVWEEQGILCRARLDWLRDDRAAIDDLKTTSASANPEAWTRRTLWDMGADIQAAFYLRGLAALGEKVRDFRWIVVETYPPYALSVVSLTPQAFELADAKVEYALNLWKRCLEADDWPGYPIQVAYAEAPGWHEAAWLEKEARGAA